MKLGWKWGVGTLLGDPCIPHLQYWLRYYPLYHCLASFQAIPSSSFWWLAACKMEGESLEEGVMCMTCGRYEGRYEGGMPDHCNSQTLRWSASNLPNNELYWCCLSNVAVSSCWTRYYTKDLKILRQAPPPPYWPHVYPHVYLTSCTWLFLPGLPLHFCMLQVIKNWRWKCPWNDVATTTMLICLYMCTCQSHHTR